MTLHRQALEVTTAAQVSAERARPRTGGARFALALLGTLVLWGAIGAVYGRVASAPLVYDDLATVKNNPSIRQLWPLWSIDGPAPLSPSPDLPTSARPLVNLTLALNYHCGGLNPRGYHLVNIALHMVAAWLVWSVIERVLRLPCFGDRFERSASLLGFAAAIVWALHPLQTESVAYVTQRTEELMAVFYLATCYASLRYWAAESRPGRVVWLAAAGGCCLAGMLSKEMMASAPVMVLLFERTFLRGTFRGALQASWPLYALLGLCWLPLGALLAAGSRTPSAGFGLGVSAITWWFTQAKVLWMYLGLCVWPWPQAIHYEIPYLETWRQAWPWVVATAVLVLASFVLAWRRNWVGYLGVWLLAILSPTLVIPLITEVAAERRMYLPLVAPVVLAVVSCYLLVSRLASSSATSTHGRPGWLANIVTLLVALTIAGGLGWASERRLAVFASEVTLWQDAAARYPDSYVAQFNLGTSLSGAGQQIEAIEHLQRAAELKPDSAEVHFNWGRALDELRLPRDAMLHYEEALRLKPDFMAAHNNLGILLANSGRFQAAIDHYQAVVDADPAFAPVRGNLAAALAAIGRTGEAIVQLEEAVRLQPTASAYANLAYGYALLHRSDDAIEAANYALQLAKRDNDPRAEAEIAAWLKQYARQPSQR